MGVSISAESSAGREGAFSLRCTAFHSWNIRGAKSLPLLVRWLMVVVTSELACDAWTNHKFNLCHACCHCGFKAHTGRASSFSLVGECEGMWELISLPALLLPCRCSPFCLGAGGKLA